MPAYYRVTGTHLAWRVLTVGGDFSIRHANSILNIYFGFILRVEGIGGNIRDVIPKDELDYFTRGVNKHWISIGEPYKAVPTLFAQGAHRHHKRGVV